MERVLAIAGNGSQPYACALFGHCAKGAVTGVRGVVRRVVLKNNILIF